MDAAPPTLADVLAHEGFVRGLARGALGRDDRVDDVVAETLWAAAGRGPRDGSLRAWLAAVVRRRSADIRRRDARVARRELAAARPEATPSTADLVVREEVRRRLVDALLALDPIHRDALVLRYHDDLPPRDVARRLGVPLDTARSRLRRGLELLRARLDAAYGGDRRTWGAALLLALDGDDSAPASVAAPPATAPARGSARVHAGPTANGPRVGGTRIAVLSLAVLLVAGGIAAGLAVPWGDRGPGDRDPAARDREARSLAAATGADDDRGVGGATTRDGDGPALAGAAAPAAAGRRAEGTAVVVGRVWRDGRPTAATIELRRVGDVRPESLRTGGDPLDRRAWVLAMGADGPALRAVTTDAHGGFEVGGLVPGVYEARVTIGGATQARPVVVGREGERVEARVEWIDGTETLEVLVRDAAGAAAAASVGLAPGDGWAWTRGPLARRTDAAGRVRFEGVPAGPLSVVGAVDDEAGVREVYVVVPRMATVELEPAAARKVIGLVTGRVTRAGTGEPVAGVWVYATEAREGASHVKFASRSAPTDAEGRFRIEGLGVGWVTVFVQGDGFLSVGLERVRDDADDPLARRTDAAGVLDVALEVVEAAPVVGRVVDPAGRPIVGARVELDPFGVVGPLRTGHHPPEQGVLNAPVEAVSGADGRFALSAPIPGHGYVVRARAPGFASGRSGAVSAGDAAEVVVTLPTAGGARFAEIRVVSEGARRPVAGARVVVWRETGPGAREGVGQGTTGRDGVAWVGPFASLEGLSATSVPAPDEAFAFARAAEPVPLTDGVTVIERAGPSATLAARVEGPDGLDLGSVVVQVFGPGIEEGMEQRGGVDATGLTEVRVPSDGRYRVVVRGTAAGVTVAGEAEGMTGAASPLRVVLVPVR